MAKERKIDLGLKDALDEMFMDDAGRAENRLPKIYDIPLSEIDDFPDHPFQVRLDEDMDQLVDSIKERGLITPITLRKKEGGRYEIVSGHRRRKACEIAGFETIRADVKELTRDEAIILMVESNLQRSKILPSEKAKAYKMRLDSMKRLPGRPAKENCDPVGHNFDGARSVEIIADDSPDSKTQVQRFIRLNFLTPELMEFVDEGKIAMRPAVELSYLDEDAQRDLVDRIDESGGETFPSHAQAIRMRKAYDAGELDYDKVSQIMAEEKPNQKPKMKISYDRVKPLIPSGYTPSMAEEYVIKALEYCKRYLERQRDRAR